MSLRNAINEMCTQCIYDKKSEGGKLQQIAACTAKHCPLFAVRPQPKGQSSD
ncbi:hypothetical protein [Neptuniibacter halophilus]|uniref:hypothetical protein n=1 Tax=Neptuniibacter halophilus TaxID=651666 RepID=UPI0025724FC1|nr:hypothetical protein [Neptuniibacter halophilus]